MAMSLNDCARVCELDDGIDDGRQVGDDLLNRVGDDRGDGGEDAVEFVGPVPHHFDERGQGVTEDRSEVLDAPLVAFPDAGVGRLDAGGDKSGERVGGVLDGRGGLIEGRADGGPDDFSAGRVDGPADGAAGQRPKAMRRAVSGPAGGELGRLADVLGRLLLVGPGVLVRLGRLIGRLLFRGLRLSLPHVVGFLPHGPAHFAGLVDDGLHLVAEPAGGGGIDLEQLSQFRAGLLRRFGDLF